MMSNVFSRGFSVSADTQQSCAGIRGSPRDTCAAPMIHRLKTEGICSRALPYFRQGQPQRVTLLAAILHCNFVCLGEDSKEMVIFKGNSFRLFLLLCSHLKNKLVPPNYKKIKHG